MQTRRRGGCPGKLRRPVARAAARVQNALPPRQTGGESVPGEMLVPQVWIALSWNHALACELRHLSSPSWRYSCDISRDAIDYARLHYSLENVRFLQASCTAMPFREGSFDLVVAFEVIEHLRDWRGFLLELRRVLTAGGQCVISTPNKNYYSESRGHTGVCKAV